MRQQLPDRATAARAEFKRLTGLIGKGGATYLADRFPPLGP